MDYLQYFHIEIIKFYIFCSFKPYYKWITFNTEKEREMDTIIGTVLNLIINGLPSILQGASHIIFSALMF